MEEDLGESFPLEEVDGLQKLGIGSKNQIKIEHIGTNR